MKEKFLSALSNMSAGTPLFVPNLTLWHDWHVREKTLPETWKDLGIIDIACELDVPGWLTVAPWTFQSKLPIGKTDSEKERTINYHTAKKVLTARWILGPDGDWWQTEYPVKEESDLQLLGEIIEAQSYIFNSQDLIDKKNSMDNGGVVAAELPMRPYSYILHHFLGWSEGLMIAMMNPDTVSELLEKKPGLVKHEVVEDGRIVLTDTPENLQKFLLEGMKVEDFFGDVEELERVNSD